MRKGYDKGGEKGLQGKSDDFRRRPIRGPFGGEHGR